MGVFLDQASFSTLNRAYIFLLQNFLRWSRVGVGMCGGGGRLPVFLFILIKIYIFLISPHWSVRFGQPKVPLIEKSYPIAPCVTKLRLRAGETQVATQARVGSH